MLPFQMNKRLLLPKDESKRFVLPPYFAPTSQQGPCGVPDVVLLRFNGRTRHSLTPVHMALVLRGSETGSAAIRRALQRPAPLCTAGSVY